ncbi:hypothetical protein U0070_012418 [Myodes glareolus]|uniref:Ig-like domain-containing protein n=1 Tax=Myodes glareolus TaxID=447135 RepID=A0AAW0H9C8_MYOGA
MNSFPELVIALFLMFGESNGDSVTQTEGHLTLSEGTSLTVNCSYETKQYPALLWYVQYPGEGPQLLFRVSKANDKGSSRGFEATYDEGSTSFHLRKSSVQESDSAVYYCALRRTRGDSVTQTEDQMVISEGRFLTINCTYILTNVVSPALFWYVQYPGESLQFLLKVITAGAKGSSRGFEATYDKGSSSFHLQKASVQESDSAVYYCALSDTVAETAEGAEHKLKGSSSEKVEQVQLWPQGVAGKTQVEQSPKSLVVLQGENCTFHCNYTVSPAYNLRWYRQDTVRGLVSLAVMSYIENEMSNGRYSAILNADAKHSTLNITAAQLEDTAFYICVVGAPCFTGVRSQQKLQQNSELLSVPEGTVASLNCTFSECTFDNFRWHRQQPEKGPELLTSIFSSGEKEEGRFTIHLNKDSRLVFLHIRVAQPSDSAVYFCAVRTQCCPGT